MPDKNPFATVNDDLKTTAAAAEFVENVTLKNIPAEAMRIGTPPDQRNMR